MTGYIFTVSQVDSESKRMQQAMIYFFARLFKLRYCGNCYC